ncbi:hypothetical protein GCM10010483_01540 [Actinokineospora diospyrosa]
MAGGGETVEEGVGGGVVGLARAAEGAGDRGEQDESVRVGQLVEVSRRKRFRPQDSMQAFWGQRFEQAVVEHSGQVEHGCESGQVRYECLQRVPIGDVARHNACTVDRTAPRAVDEDDVAGTGVDEVLGEGLSESAGAAGDQDGAVGVDGARQGEDDLAGVTALADEPERLGRAAHVPGPNRWRGERARGEQGHDLVEDLADPVRSRLAQVERAVAGDAVAEVGLAHLDEPAAGAQQPERGVDELARQGIEDHVDLRELGGEVEVPGRREVAVIKTCGRPFRWARGAEDLGFEMTGELYRGRADTTGGGVDQD